MKASNFRKNGPQLVAKEYGPEPSLRSLVLDYYLRHFRRAKAEKLTAQYIAGWIKRNAKE